MVEASHAPPPERRHSGGTSRKAVPSAENGNARDSHSSQRSRTPPWQKEMPRNGDYPLVKLGRTGPVYVRLDGIPMIGHGAATRIATSKLQELIKEDMCRQVAGVRGFEDVHIYSRPLNQPGYAIFVFDNEGGNMMKPQKLVKMSCPMPIVQHALCTAAARFGFHMLIQTFVDGQMTMSWRPSSIMILRRRKILAPAERDRRLKERAKAEQSHAGVLLRGQEDESPAAGVSNEQAQMESNEQPTVENPESPAAHRLLGPAPRPGPPPPQGPPERAPSEEAPPPPPGPLPQDEQACNAEETQPLLADTKKESAAPELVTLTEAAATKWQPPLPAEMQLSSAASDWQPPLPDEAPQSSPAAAAQHEGTPPLPPPPELASVPLLAYLPPGVALQKGGGSRPPVLPPGIGALERGHAAAGVQPVRPPPLLPVHADMLLPPHLRGLTAGLSSARSVPEMQPYDRHYLIGGPTPLREGLQQPPWALYAREEPRLADTPAAHLHWGLADSRASMPIPDRVPMTLDQGDRTPEMTGTAEIDEQQPFSAALTGAPAPLGGYDRLPALISTARKVTQLIALGKAPQPGLLTAEPGIPDTGYGNELPEAPGLSLRHFLPSPPPRLPSISGGEPPRTGGAAGLSSLELRHVMPDGPNSPDGPGSGPQLPGHMQGARGMVTYPAFDSGLRWQADGALPQAGDQLHAAGKTSGPGAFHPASVPTAPENCPSIKFACHAPSKVVRAKQARLPAFSMSSQETPSHQNLPDDAAQEETQHVHAQQSAMPDDNRQEAATSLVNGHLDRPPRLVETNREAQPQKRSMGVRSLTAAPQTSSERLHPALLESSSSQPQKQEESGRPRVVESPERPAPSALGDRSAQSQKQTTVGAERGRDEPERKRFETGRRTVGRAPQAAPAAVVGRYPSRPGMRGCSFYMRTGYCKFGTECVFDHPKLGSSKVGLDQRIGPDMSPGLPNSSIMEVSPAAVGSSRAVHNDSRMPTPFSSGRTPHSRSLSPVRIAGRLGSRQEKFPADRCSTERGRRPASRDKTPLADRRSTEGVATRLRDDAQRDQRPRSRDPTPHRRGSRRGSGDGMPTAGRRSAGKLPTRPKTDAHRSRDPRSRDPTPPSRGRRSGSKEHARIAERRSTERVAVRQRSGAPGGSSPTFRPERHGSETVAEGAHDRDALMSALNTPEPEQPSNGRATSSAAPRRHADDREAPRAGRRSCERAPPEQDAEAGKGRERQAPRREERLHQLHEAGRAGKSPTQATSKRSRERSWSRHESPKWACNGSSGLRRASGPQDSSTTQNGHDQQARMGTPNVASDRHPAANQRLHKPHMDAGATALDSTPAPVAAHDNPGSKGTTPTQNLIDPALDWSPGDTFDDTPDRHYSDSMMD